ncbi:MAG: CaiB/BaiF CoA-transferase family protein [Paracoccaceae bacterium]
MRPLSGLLVVAVEQAVAAPLCTARLAAAGARVIKIERPEGDFARGYDRAAGGDSSYFAWINQGKESVVADFREPRDRALLETLFSRADVVVQNLAPGALERAGFSTATLRARHPRLITCDISGYGEAPELAGKKAYDLLVQAEAGLVAISGGPGEMGRIGVSICDIGAGITAHAAVLEALIARGVSGTGSGVAVSLFDVAAEWMTVPLVHAETGDGAPTRQGLSHPSIAPYGAFATQEGALTVLSVQNEREWVRLCADVLGRSDMARDARYVSNNARVAHRDALEGDMATVIGTMSAADFRQRLSQAGIAFGAISSVADLGQHPALRRHVVRASTGTHLHLPAHPVRSGAPVAGPARVPRLGEHTEAVRREFMGAADAAQSSGK